MVERWWLAGGKGWMMRGREWSNIGEDRAVKVLESLCILQKKGNRTALAMKVMRTTATLTLVSFL